MEDAKSLLDTATKGHEERERQLEQSLAQEKETSSSLDSQLLQLQRSLLRHRNTIANETGADASQSDDSVGQVEALFQTIEKYKRLNEEYSEKARKAEEATGELRREVVRLKGVAKDLEEAGDVKAQEHAKELIEVENKLNAAVAEEKGRTMDLRTKLMEKRSVLMKLTTEKKAAEKQHRDSVEQGKALEEEVREKTASVAELEAKIRHMNMVIARIHKEKEEDRESHLERLSKVELEKVQLGVDIDQLREQKQAVADAVEEKKEKIAQLKDQVSKEQAGQEKLRQQLAELGGELESSRGAVLEAQAQAEEAAEASRREIDSHVSSLETSRAMIQKQADHISSLESELSERDEQIRGFQEAQHAQEEELQEARSELDAKKEEYDKLVAEMPMRVRAKIFKPVLRGREKALKEKIDLGGVRKNLKRVGRKSMASKPPPPPPKDEEP